MKERRVISARQVNIAPLGRRNLFDIMRDATPSRSLTYIYIPLGKCANTEVKRMLWQFHRKTGFLMPVPDDYFAVHNYGWEKSYNIGASPWDCYTKVDYARLIQDMTDSNRFFRFAIVRNPYARLLSGYLDKIVGTGETLEKASQAHGLRGTPTSFREFVELVVDQADIDRDIHWSTQVYKLAYEFFTYDYVGHFENLKEAKDVICSRIMKSDVDYVIARPIHKTDSNSRLEKYYDSTLAEMVYRAYAVDFETFGYTSDISSLGPCRKESKPGRHKSVLRRVEEILEAGEEIVWHTGTYLIDD